MFFTIQNVFAELKAMESKIFARLWFKNRGNIAIFANGRVLRAFALKQKQQTIGNQK